MADDRAPDRTLMLGTAWCSDCKRAKQFFAEQRIPYDYVDIDGDAEARARVEQLNGGKSIIPTLLLPDGRVLVEPSNAELATAFGITTEPDRPFYDLVVVGSGPAGLTAALYAAREGIETLVVERGGVGGQAGVTERLDNFPGFPEGVTGEEFAGRLRAQALRFGVEILAATEVTSLSRDGHHWAVHLNTGEQVRAHAVLLATGSTYRRLGIPGEDDLIGAGVHFCATCDGAFYRDKDVLVVGGGNSAGEEGLFLTKFARTVTLVTRDPALSASKVVVDKVERHPAITVRTSARPVEIRGDGSLETVVLENLDTGETEEVHPDGVFVFIGLTPNADLAGGLADTDAGGFLTTDGMLAAAAPGLFVAGDVRAGSTKQAASAAGEGAAAALAIRRYLESVGAGLTMDPTH